MWIYICICSLKTYLTAMNKQSGWESFCKIYVENMKDWCSNIELTSTAYRYRVLWITTTFAGLHHSTFCLLRLKENRCLRVRWKNLTAWLLFYPARLVKEVASINTMFAMAHWKKTCCGSRRIFFTRWMCWSAWPVGQPCFLCACSPGWSQALKVTFEIQRDLSLPS